MLPSRLNKIFIPADLKTINFKKLMVAAWANLRLASLLLGSILILSSPASAALDDMFDHLKLTNKVVDKAKRFVVGNIKYKNTNVTIVGYLPKPTAKPITALVFDTFSLADYVTDPVEKALMKDFVFRGAALIAVPEGSGALSVKASDLPAPMVEAMGGASSPLFPLELKTGVNFAAGARLRPGSIPKVLLTSVGLSKTSHYIKGTFSAKFFDLTCVVSPTTPVCKLFSLKDLLALLNLNFSEM